MAHYFYYIIYYTSLFIII